MAYEHIVVEQDERVTTVRINRPKVMNSLHPDAHREMDDAFNAFAADEDQWVAILTGTGDKAFSAGNDLKWHAQHGPAALVEAMEKTQGGFGGLHRRTDLVKPIIAAVNGVALGGGLEMVLCCDIVVAAEHASFGLPEPTVGLMALAGGVHRLPRQIGLRQALGMMLTARRVSAAEALAMGLINEVVPAEALMDTARKWAADILKCAPLSVRATKEACLKGLDMPLEEAMAEVFPETMKMYGSPDMLEGPAAFAEKRAPVWKGK